jgi:hypothetical protein
MAGHSFVGGVKNGVGKQAVSPQKRAAQSKLVKMVMDKGNPAEERPSA